MVLEPSYNLETLLEQAELLMKEDPDSFRSFYKTHIESRKNWNKKEQKLKSLMLWGEFLFRNENDYKEAIKTINQAKELIDKKTNHYLAARVLRNLGVCNHVIGNYDESMRCYLDANTHLELIPKKTFDQNYELALSYHNIAILFKAQNDQPKRLEYLKKAMQISKKINSDKGMAICFNALSNYYLQQNELEKALNLQNKALDLRIKIKDFSGMGATYNNIATIYMEKGDLHKAADYLEKAYQFKIQVGNVYQLTNHYIAEGELFIALSNPNRAIEAFKKGVELALQNDLTFELAMLFEHLANVYELIEDYKLANEYRKDLLHVNKKLFDSQKGKALLELKNKFELEKKDREAKILKTRKKEIELYANRLETMNNELKQFAHIASHDLKEPIRTMRMYLMLMEKRLQSSVPEVKEYIDLLKESSERMYNLVNDLLLFTKMDFKRSNAEPIPMLDLIEDVKKILMQVITEKKATIELRSIHTLLGEKFQILQLFQNLIFNGIHYNRSEHPKIVINAVEEEDFLICSISDNGIGIEEEYWDKIFNIFQRLHNEEEYTGTGIGLAICKRVAENHGGKIWVESSLGVGSTFYIQLPAFK